MGTAASLCIFIRHFDFWNLPRLWSGCPIEWAYPPRPRITASPSLFSLRPFPSCQCGLFPLVIASADQSARGNLELLSPRFCALGFDIVHDPPGEGKSRFIRIRVSEIPAFAGMTMVWRGRQGALRGDDNAQQR
jgi:hypothetical protein